MKNYNFARNILIHLLAFLMLALVLPFVVLPVFAQEVIRSFTSDVVLLKDGSVDVIETIEVRAEGKKIKRGIFRDIPTLMKNADGSQLKSKLEVISIKKNGESEPFFIENITGGKRIYIGQSDVFLQSGIYRYEIRYSMSRMARIFKNHDELYWNATGNYWDFPIEKAVATITLPDGAIISELTGYTGAFGETGAHVKASKTGRNSASFIATRQFAPYEGMSVAVKFQKGVLIEPEGFAKVWQYLIDRVGLLLPIFSVFLVLAYYFIAWKKVGKDPKKGVIVPLFYPPKNFSPALVHYVHEMGWKKNGWSAFSAALVSLVVKGLITIIKKQGSTQFLLKSKSSIDLPVGERVIYEYIASKRKVVVDKNTGAKINSVRKEFLSLIGSENRSVYFKNNYSYLIVGYIISALCLLLMVAGGVLHPVLAFGGIFAGIALGIFASAIGGLWAGGGFAKLFLFVWVFLLISNIMGSVFSIVANLNIDIAFIASLSIVIITIVFTYIMRAPTIHGRKIMDQIDGFKMYLETAEKERLNMFDVPQMSVVRFETILPYAIALGVEKPWSEHFERELARHAVADAPKSYNPNWYSGTKLSSSSIAKNLGGLATGMSAALIASQPSSSSSSGFSGGGSSGGGGGGGGGGGW